MTRTKKNQDPKTIVSEFLDVLTTDEHATTFSRLYSLQIYFCRPVVVLVTANKRRDTVSESGGGGPQKRCATDGILSDEPENWRSLGSCKQDRVSPVRESYLIYCTAYGSSNILIDHRNFRHSARPRRECLRGTSSIWKR